MYSDKLMLYMHAGSGNHGCEAIVNSLCHLVKRPVYVISNDREEDLRYSLGSVCEVGEEKHMNRNVLVHTAYYAWRKLTRDSESFLRYRYPQIFKKDKPRLAVSIGGDNYCYDNMLGDLILANRAINKAGVRTVLLGCSIEPKLFDRPEVVADMKKYHAIYARESITYEALLATGLSPERVKLYPDPAFTLEPVETQLPDGFEPGNTIGLNMSPMIEDSEQVAGITMANYHAFIQHILDTTSYKIALIPHVVWARNDDLLVLGRLYEKYKDTGRVILVGDHTCQELKYIISKCNYFVGARTHATIAAYSSLIPTLVVGYSVKAKGIAKDLFGASEGYVLPVQSLEREEDLICAFEWIVDRQTDIISTLQEKMPTYMEQAKKMGNEIDLLWAE